MKTKFFKIVIPAFAIVLAVAVSAFTSFENSTEVEGTLIQGYIPTGNPLEPCGEDVRVECSLIGNNDCTYESFPNLPVYDDTMCSNQLSKINL
ncbi:MAG TPA: DUF6520 family protein [Aquaticitalea sp.]|nr:DUF6520 family protein [Aquaticitalea sp.]